MNSEQFTEVMKPLLDLFTPPPTWKPETFHRLINHLSVEEFKESCQIVAQAFKPTYSCPFPVPSNILEVAREIRSSTPKIPEEQLGGYDDEGDRVYAAVWEYMALISQDEKTAVKEVAKKRIEMLEKSGLLNRLMPNVSDKFRKSAYISAFCEIRQINLEGATEAQIRRLLWEEGQSSPCRLTLIPRT